METKEPLQVWVDDDLCSGCGACVKIAPEVFVHVNGLAHVKDGDETLESMQTAQIRTGLLSKVISAAEQCPGEIIMIEPIGSPTRQSAREVFTDLSQEPKPEFP